MCRYVRLNALNVPHVPWPRFIAPWSVCGGFDSIFVFEIVKNINVGRTDEQPVGAGWVAGIKDKQTRVDNSQPVLTPSTLAQAGHRILPKIFYVFSQPSAKFMLFIIFWRMQYVDHCVSGNSNQAAKKKVETYLNPKGTAIQINDSEDDSPMEKMSSFRM